MAVIKQFDKRTGITYIYESKSYWDKEKKMTRAKRKLLGKLDPETGEIVPTDGRNRKGANKATKEKDYKKLYEKEVRENEAKQVLIDALKKEIKDLKGR